MSIFPPRFFKNGRCFASFGIAPTASSLVLTLLLTLLWQPACLAIRVYDIGREEAESKAVSQHEPVDVIGRDVRDPCCCTRLQVEVVASIDERPLGGVSVYLKAVKGEEISNVCSSSIGSPITIGSIKGQQRTIYAADRAGNYVTQRLNLHEGKLNHLVIRMPYDALITVNLPRRRALNYAYALRQRDGMGRTVSAGEQYDADTHSNAIRLPLPAGTYRIIVPDSPGLYASVFGRENHRRSEGRFEKTVTVRPGQKLALRLQEMRWQRDVWLSKR